MRIIYSVILVLVFFADLNAKDNVIWPDDVYKEASELVSNGEYTKAEEVYKKFLVDFPTAELTLYVKYDLAVCYFLQKKIDNAIKIFEELNALNTGIKEMVCTSLGECYIEQNNFDKAMACYEKGNKSITGGSAVIYFAIASLQFIQKDFSKAKNTIQFIQNRFPAHEITDSAELLLARILVEEKDENGANKIFESKIVNMQKNPLIANIIYQVANQLFAAKSFEHAIIFYKRVPGKDIILSVIQNQIDEAAGKVKSIEKTRAPGMEKTIGLWKKKETDLKKSFENVKSGKDLALLSKLKIGQCYIEMKKFQEARKSYNELITLAPQDDLVKDANYATAVSYMLEGNTGEFNTRAQKFIKENADTELGDNLRLGYIDSLLKKSSYKKVITEYREGLFKFNTKKIEEEGMYKIGLAFYGSEDYKEAENIFEEVIKKAEKGSFTGWSLFYQGNAYYNLLEYDKAIASYQRILDEYPQEEFYKNTLYQMGFSYGKKGAYIKAVEYLNLFIQKYPKDEMCQSILSSIADIYMADQKYKEAYDTYEKALKDYPKSSASPRIRSQMGDLFYKQGKYEDMSRMYEKLLEDYPDSPYCSEACYWIGWSLITGGKKDEGYKKFDEARKWNNTEIGRKIQFKIAEYNFSEKEFDKAKQDYEYLVSNVDEYEIVDTSLDRLADIYARQKMLDEGIAKFAEFAEKKKDNKTLLGKVKMAMIDLYFRQKKVDEALKLWKEISKSIPKEYFTARNYYIVASNLESIGMENEALKLYNEAISRYTEDGVLPYIYARIAYQQLDSGKKAGDVYEFLKKPMAKFKDMSSLPEISLVFAEYNFDSGKIEEAVKYYKKSINKAKGKIGAESTFKLASSYFKLKKYKEALMQYAKVAFIYSAYKDLAEEALYNSGRCAELINLKDDAKKYYEALLQRYPNGKYKKEAESKIKELK